MGGGESRALCRSGAGRSAPQRSAIRRTGEGHRETRPERACSADAPADLQKLLGGEDAVAGGNIKLPTDPKALRKLAASLAQHLGDRSRALQRAATTCLERPDDSILREFGEFDYEDSKEGDGEPGSGGLSRGRGDADLTWGDESIPFDRFKSVALPPGSVRSPDDWSPVAVLPGAPKEAPERAVASTGMQFAGTSGQAALAPDAGAAPLQCRETILRKCRITLTPQPLKGFRT